MISTLLFSAFPDSVLLLAIGLDSPKPAILKFVVLIPFDFSHLTTDCARLKDKSSLNLASPSLSVWPTISILRFGWLLRNFSNSFKVAFDSPPVCRCTGGAVNLMDFTTNKSRPVTLKDCRDIAHLIDGLGNTTFAATQTPSDALLPVYDIQALKVMLETGRKHIWALASSSVNLVYQLEMMMAVCGSEKALTERPICHGIVTVLEQFRFSHDEIERLMLYGRYKIPVKVPIVPMMGANAPTTIAGTMVQANAEAVASVVLINYLCPGTPTWYYFLPGKEKTVPNLKPRACCVDRLTFLVKRYRLAYCCLKKRRSLT